MTTAAPRGPAEALWRAVLRHGTWQPGKRTEEPLDVPHMLACGLDLSGDKTDPDWGIEHEAGGTGYGYGSMCDLSGPSFHGCIVCRCGQHFGVWEWNPSPVEFVTAILEEAAR